MANIINNIFREGKSFVAQQATSARNAYDDFARENPELKNALLIYGGIKACNLLKSYVRHKRATNRYKQNIHKNWYYDARTRCYFELRRPMTNTEKMILSRKIARGYLACDVLSDMGLLRF